jgi:uncharacterized protein (DUF433 family)
MDLNDLNDLIVSQSDLLGGEPCFRGTWGLETAP